MDEQFAALRHAFAAAGIDVPDDPLALELAALDDLVTDRRLRATCKSTLTKFKRAAEAAGWTAPAGDATEDAAPTLVAASEPAAAEADNSVGPTLEEAPAPVTTSAERVVRTVVREASPMSDDLQAKFDGLLAAAAAASFELPADPCRLDLDSLDSQIDDKSLRGKVKSALVKFRKQAAAEDWQAGGVVEEVVEATVSVPNVGPTLLSASAGAGSEADNRVGPALGEEQAPAPTPTKRLVKTLVREASPMSEDLQAKFTGLQEAAAAASYSLPDDPLGIDLDGLDAQIEDKSLRGKVKSAFVKFRKQAQAEEWQSGGVVEEVVEAEPDATGSAPAAATAAPAPAPAVEIDEAEDDGPEPEYVATPMSEALAGLYRAVQEAYAAVGLALPADPVNVSLDSLDEQVEDKKARGRLKSSLTKFRRLATDEGWQAGPAPRTRKVKASPAAAPALPVAAAAGAPPTTSKVPVQPAGTPAELFLLTPEGWLKLGTATRQTTPSDDLIGAKTAAGATQRITSILLLDGQFTVPEDLYNTHCYLAHEGVVYKAYYISHIGDVKRGTKSASLKVDETFTYESFGRSYVALGEAVRPTADDTRRWRFGRQYDCERRMFADETVRLA